MLNPKIDFVFRKLFGSEENKDLLISLINSVVSPTPDIVDVTIKNPFNLAAYQSAKESILDIKAVDQHGTWYDIEMQIQAHSLYGRRAVYYLSKTYVDQLESGEDFSNLHTTIGIHFLDFNYFNDDRVLRQFIFKDAETNETPLALSCIRLYFVEMGKFHKEWPEIRSALDRWIAFLNKAGDLDQNRLPQELENEPAVAKAVFELEKMGMNPVELAVYKGEVKKNMVDAIQIRDAKQEGISQGISQGLLQGLSQGLGRGIIRQMRRRFGLDAVSSDTISRLGQLSTEQLDSLSEAVLDFQSADDLTTWLSCQR